MMFGEWGQLLGLALFAMLYDIVFGWSSHLTRAIGHPVMWIGRLIEFLDKSLKADDRLSDRSDFLRGVLLSILVIAVSVSVSLLLVWLVPDSLIGQAVMVICCASLLATRSLYTHVQSVRLAFDHPGNCLESARAQLSNIVGRETANLDEAGISRAAIESLSENTSDGVIAPLFWLLLLGFPGLVFYKTVNTLDSMMGYRNARYEYFGKFAARLDDLVNWLPARLTAVLYLSAAGSMNWHQFSGVATEARGHVSSNAGWPEAAVAMVLSVRLGGEREYQGEKLMGYAINDNAPEPDRASLSAALMLYQRLIGVCIMLLALAFVIALIL